MRINERRLRNIIRQEILREAEMQGMLSFQGGYASDRESDIPYSVTLRDDNTVKITNAEPGSKLSVTLTQVALAGDAKSEILEVTDLPAGSHSFKGSPGMRGMEQISVSIELKTRNGNTLYQSKLISYDDYGFTAQQPTGVEIRVGRQP